MERRKRAPLAIQVCDRWHVLKNLGEAVEAFLIRARIRLPEASQVSSSSIGATEPAPSFSSSRRRQFKSQASLLLKWQLRERIQELHSQGMSRRRIGEELHLARNTVRKYFRQPPEPPQPTPRPLRASILDPYEAYLLKRYQEGCRNAALLEREIREQGYQGSNSLVGAYIRYLRNSPGQALQSRKERARSVSPRELRWLLSRKREELERDEQEKLHSLLSLSTDVQKVYVLLQSFLEMMRERKHEQLRAWMEEATKTGIPELKSFVGGIERDYDAVKAALCLPWIEADY